MFRALILAKFGAPYKHSPFFVSFELVYFELESVYFHLCVALVHQIAAEQLAKLVKEQGAVCELMKLILSNTLIPVCAEETGKISAVGRQMGKQ